MHLIIESRAIRNFKKLKNVKDVVLFVNLDASILDGNRGISKYWTKHFAEEEGLDFRSIAVEIVESRIENNENLTEIIESYKATGFFVVLDDFGALHSNLNRIVLAKPDIIKIDRYLVDNVSNDYYQQSIIQSIIDLAKKIGSLTLAEGLENEEDVLKCYELGIDLFQGYYFATPQPFTEEVEEKCVNKLHFISHKVKHHIINTINHNQSQQSKHEETMNFIVDNLSGMHVGDYFTHLERIACELNEVECIYLLDSRGIQLGPTVCNRTVCDMKEQRLIFKPADNSADHSLKDYYYYVNHLNIDRFYTDPYISLATGYLCRTLSQRLQTSTGTYILCVDFIDKKLRNI
ncbi:EAL domain-containing protein [Limisalsivibrio acetivorans]|uniref:EAL domain-containing protein n=1 Tax=Limisalsivibrio acetivorans TaxID=1304888 RepID=UPI0003B32154|nr:EAL domain-containing protein [Limisalsivibrio acetivorans]